MQKTITLPYCETLINYVTELSERYAKHGKTIEYVVYNQHLPNKFITLFFLGEWTDTDIWQMGAGYQQVKTYNNYKTK